MMNVQRSNIQLKADPKRVILRYLGLNPERRKKLVHRCLAIPETEIRDVYKGVISGFVSRHRNPEMFFLAHFEKIAHIIPKQEPISEIRKLLMGAYFTMEYSIQAAALFNPSIVPHPDQGSLKPGQIRFVMSLRPVGEGHISSVEFRSGIIQENGNIILDEISPFSTTPEIQLIENPSGMNSDFQDYDAFFDSGTPLSERVIFPVANCERNGMEDVRLVNFEESGKPNLYIGTYTAYDGHQILPRLILTSDFLHFQIRTMKGSVVNDKGFALFPEKINGRYAMIARQGGEDITIMFSEDLFQWEDYQIIMSPESTWGLVQIGNCGSPIKTDEGWLLITHAVGPVRKYVISAILLDLNDPSKIISKLPVPILSPLESEREGYVPNVVYSCGSMVHNGMLIIPYAMSDSATSFATVSLNEILATLKMQTK